MRFLFLLVILFTFHFPALSETAFFSQPAANPASSSYLQPDSLHIADADSTLSNSAKEKIKGTGMYKTFRDMEKYRALLYLACFIGAIVTLRYSGNLLRIADRLLLRIQHRPNTFDSFQYTGNPFILKSPFYALYHLFLGKNAYQTYLVWPLKYSIALSFIAVIVIRIFPNEAFITTESFRALILSSLQAQIAFGLLFLSYLSIVVLNGIESFRKTKWLFPVRLAIFLLSGLVIFTLMYWLFWLIVLFVVLYLFTNMGRDCISRQRVAAAGGYPNESFLYEPWPDSSTKNYPG